MNRFKNFAIKRPFLFGLTLIFIDALLGTLTYPTHFLFPAGEVGQLSGDALAKFIVFLCFLLILWRFGWLKASRIDRWGNTLTGVIVILILAYKIPLQLYAFTGDMAIKLPPLPLTMANLVYSLQTGLVAMISAWGETKKGQIKAIVLSAVFFGLMHMFNIIVRPFGVVLFQPIIVSLPGILYAALVLIQKSLWPVIVLHWLTNAVVNIQLIGRAAYQETFSMWIIYAIILMPIVAYSIFLIHKLPESYQYEMEAAN